MYTNLLIFLQELPNDLPMNGADLLTYGGGAVGGGGAIWFIRENIVQILSKLNSISKKIDEISAISSEKNEKIEEQKKKVNEVLGIISKENERGEKILYSASHNTAQIMDTLAIVNKSLTGITEALSNISKRNQGSDKIQLDTISIVNALVNKMEIAEKLAELKK